MSPKVSPRRSRSARTAPAIAAPRSPARGVGPILIGTALGFLAFEVVARLTAGLSLAASWLLTGVVALVAVVAIEVLMARCGPPRALAGLGFGRPAGRALAVGAVIGALFLALLPAVSWVTDAGFALPVDWLLLALGVFALNGVAEEALYRGYLFRHLRRGRSFRRAVVLGMVVHAASHLPILATAGVAVWAAASVVALASFPPLAYLFERGRNTLWAPALVHAAIDSLKLVITAETTASQGALTATFVWMGLAVVLPYLAFGLLRGGEADRVEASESAEVGAPAERRN
jgi:membrane protease YdiL (CAAX protease family)